MYREHVMTLKNVYNCSVFHSVFEMSDPKTLSTLHYKNSLSENSHKHSKPSIPFL